VILWCAIGFVTGMIFTAVVFKLLDWWIIGSGRELYGTYRFTHRNRIRQATAKAGE